MGTTPKGFPFPGAAVSNNVPADIQALAEMVEAYPGIPSLTQTQIDALSSGAKTTGWVIHNATTSQLQKWTGAAWVNVAPVITISTAAPSGGADGDIWITYIP